MSGHFGTNVVGSKQPEAEVPGFCRSRPSSHMDVFTRDSIYAIARICHANSVCPSICLSVRRLTAILE